MLEERVVYFAREETCQRIAVEGVEEEASLRTNHEEADSKIAYLVQHAVDNTEELNHMRALFIR